MTFSLLILNNLKSVIVFPMLQKWKKFFFSINNYQETELLFSVFILKKGKSSSLYFDYLCL